MRGNGGAHEAWAWMMTDDETGELAIAYVETAGATKVPMIANSEKGAEALRLIVEKMVEVTHRPWTLVHFTGGTEVETVEP